MMSERIGCAWNGEDAMGSVRNGCGGNGERAVRARDRECNGQSVCVCEMGSVPRALPLPPYTPSLPIPQLNDERACEPRAGARDRLIRSGSAGSLSQSQPPPLADSVRQCRLS